MSSGGGKPSVQNYDPSFKDAEMSASKVKIQDDVQVRAYQAAKEANYMRDFNVKLLRDGLGFMSDLMENQITAQRVQADQAALRNTSDAQNMINEAMSSAQQTSDRLNHQVTQIKDSLVKSEDPQYLDLGSGILSRGLNHQRPLTARPISHG